MSTIVFDIETAGEDFEALDKISQETFLKFASNDEERQAAKDSLSLFPVTAQIITIAMVEVETGKGYVYYQNDGQKERFSEGENFFMSGSEEEILNYFWKHMKDATQFVTFNGRTFDCPFLMIRSAIRKIRPLKNIMPYRYDYKFHIDLADQLSFYDALRRKFSLHLWCRAFGVESPKEDGMSGDQVKDLFRGGQHLDIARYCLGDVVATKKLYQHWDKYLKT